ncbi:ABC-ATPase domain-containing protein [Virgibacillus necropolis]|uniref:ATPase n=1 Tax=Virgibacillus necropolis TaxID=163877 RepID=A0A221MG97_9BACI|nr:ABC-ATPase domain-containing protein [Virgibacillus necropolis]ASN06654.1 ATPase [Virgibacillus necropolis]
MEKLIQSLRSIDGKGYKAYKSIQGYYKYDNFDLYIDYVQGDPFATPSKARIVVPAEKRKINENWLTNYQRKIAAEDRIARAVGQAVKQNTLFIKGSGKSGLIQFDAPHQEVIERSAVSIDEKSITICLSIGLPANGRRINGKEAVKLFNQAIPSIINKSIFTISDQAIHQVTVLADQQHGIREKMRENNWIAFIANGAILPRSSGVSDQPLNEAIPFTSPAENEVEIKIPHQEELVKGMAVKRGITLIVGGGYHGKSTLLEAIERGVYNHKKGDGREYVLTDPSAVKIRAEDGRQVTGVNISPFITNLPHKQKTEFFTTENASGSTSQAANVMEALEVDAMTLLIDEDTSATNFMIRDHRMQQLVKSEQEPITPFIDKVKQLHDQLSVSTIIVMGGSGDYFDIADNVIMMEEYVPKNVTEKVKEITRQYPAERAITKGINFGEIKHRQIEQSSFQTTKGKRAKVQAKGLTKILMGKTEITFAQTEQLVDSSQTRMIAEIIMFLDKTNELNNQQTLLALLVKINEQINRKGLASFTAYPDQHPGDLARPRTFEIAAVLNRMRTLRVNQQRT